MVLNLAFGSFQDIQKLYFYRWHPNSLTSIKKQEDYGKRIESMLIKNRILYEPMNLEQKRFFYSCLNKGIKAQGKRSLIFLKAFFYEQMGRFVAKLKRVWG